MPDIDIHWRMDSGRRQIMLGAMDDHARNDHLFVVRIWVEPGTTSSSAQRGYIEHVVSGQRQYFARYEEAIAFLAAFARCADASG